MAGRARIVLPELGAYVRVGTEDGVMNPFREWPCAVTETVTEKAERGQRRGQCGAPCVVLLVVRQCRGVVLALRVRR